MAQIPMLMARRFSTSGAVPQMVKPPVQVFGTEGRYATALFSAASKEKQLEVVEKELKDLKKSVGAKSKLVDFLADPSLQRLEKKNLVSKALESTKASKLTKNLLVLLAENGRLNRLSGIVGCFETIMSAHRGEVECEVITAKALDPAMQKELEAALKSFVQSGKSVLIKTRVDPAIMGGMIVSIGDKYVDMSTASKIKKYSELIKAAV